MKILGLGVDIVNITRVDNIINYKKKFLKKLLKIMNLKIKKSTNLQLQKNLLQKKLFPKQLELVLENLFHSKK